MWSPPLDIGCSSILTYKVSRLDAGSWVQETNSITDPFFTVASLSPGLTYSFKVEALNSHGIGQPAQINLTVGTPPSGVGSVSLAAFTDTSLSLTWGVPSNTGFNSSDPSSLLEWNL